MSRIWVALAIASWTAACFRGGEQSPTSAFTCSTSRDCGEGMTCDDGLCCRPGGAPSCPTLAAPDGTCPDGEAAQTYYLDEDRDGHGDAARPLQLCATPVTAFVSTTSDDCEDDPREGGGVTWPGAPEQCDGRDNDCDGKVDFEFFRDADGDGFGDSSERITSCKRPPGYVEDATDCAPDEFRRNPRAEEICNKVDDDCDGSVDDGVPTTRWYQDNDGDGFGGAAFIQSCFQPEGYRSAGNDCDDANPGRFPGNFEACDGAANDCDASVDERPDCGGQTNLLAQAASITRGAQETGVLATSLNDFQHCFRDYSPAATGFGPEIFAAPGWAAFGDTVHVAWVETSRTVNGQRVGWDLRQAGKVLNLEFRANYGGNVADTGSTNIYEVWGTLNQPIVILCDREGRFRRLRPTTQIRDGGAPVWVASVPVAASGGSISQTVSSVTDTGSWVMFGDPNFDLGHVVRVEVLLQMNSVEGDGITPYFNATFTRLGF